MSYGHISSLNSEPLIQLTANKSYCHEKLALIHEHNILSHNCSLLLYLED